MNVREINQVLASPRCDQPTLWPHLCELQRQALQFAFNFGLPVLPEQAGLLLIRGPRQYGKSTWLEQNLFQSAVKFGPGSSFYLNGDGLLSLAEFVTALREIHQAYSPRARQKRLFIDEITAIEQWEKGIKLVLDEGLYRDTLIVTTGSKAWDLRRGAEKLPGRKGRLSRSEYIFLPVSYAEFHARAGKKFGEKSWIAYLLSGGSPLGLNEIYQHDRLPEYFIQLVRDWIMGDVVASGRSRMNLHNLLRTIMVRVGTPTGFAKLARESGLANNTVAGGYIEQLSDLLCLIPSWPWDESRKIFVNRKPCKFHFINLTAAIALHPLNLRSLDDFEKLDEKDQAGFMEWMVAQELWRRQVLGGVNNPEMIGFWQSESHEIDFVTAGGDFVEVKRGQASPFEFSWFSRSFPRKKLKVVCSRPFLAQAVEGVTLHEFLLECP